VSVKAGFSEYEIYKYEISKYGNLQV
jgi:hypothetical protein